MLLKFKNVVVFKGFRIHLVSFYLPFLISHGNKEINLLFLGNEWTPLYLSMAEATPEIGEKAKNHVNEFADRVVFGNFLFYLFCVSIIYVFFRYYENYRTSVERNRN